MPVRRGGGAAAQHDVTDADDIGIRPKFGQPTVARDVGACLPPIVLAVDENIVLLRENFELFPAHEVDKFTELFWARIQDWRAKGCP